MKCFTGLIVICALAAVSQAALMRERRNTLQGILGENDKNRLSGKFADIHTDVHGRPFHESSAGVHFENKQTGLGASISRDRNSKGADAITKALTGNFPLNDNNNLLASYGKSQMKNNGFEFSKNTGSLGWEHANGHGVSGSISRFSDGIGKQGAIDAYTNLYKSPSANTVLNANAGASKWLSGPYSNQRTNYNFGLSGTHFFRG